jgi:ABC-type lipoprotein release transport system permease subunit
VILIEMALRNLWSHKIKSVIVGGLLVFGTALIFVGLSALSSIDTSITQSVVGSIAGHIQVYDKKAKDKLALFGTMDGTNEVGQINDFAGLRALLEAQPEVDKVIPMGTGDGIVYGGNILDIQLERLRKAVAANDTARVQVLKAHVRRISSLLAKDLAKVGDVVDVSKASEELRQGIMDVEAAGKDTFWQDFDRDPLAALEFLENKIAPLALNAEMLFIQYVGTDTTRFAKAFDRFELVQGEMIPDGQRGFLFNTLAYEEYFKHKTARRLDKIKDRLAEGHTFANDEDLRNLRKLNVSQYKDVTYQLDDQASEQVKKALQAELQSKEEDLDKLVAKFAEVDESNFSRRYKVFYDAVAPHLILYSAKVGDLLTIKSFSLSGYPTSVSVKIYGTFRFKSLEKSTLAGAMNILDIMTFRDLFGYLSAEKKAELQELQKVSQVKVMARETAEDELFGGDAEEVEDLGAAPTPAAADTAVAPTPSEAGVAAVGAPPAASPTSGGFDEFSAINMKENSKKFGEEVLSRKSTQAEIDGGVVRNAAIILKPGVDTWQATTRLTELLDKEKPDVQLMGWREASGYVGQFVYVIYSVLVAALGIIFIVAMVIINNSTVMATLERTKEIGTLRAMGAQRGVVLRMILVESMVLAFVFGLMGLLIGSAVIGWGAAVGFPASNDVMVFLFGGPRLHLSFSAGQAVGALLMVQLVTVISSLYPAWLATRVTPLQAMQDAE